MKNFAKSWEVAKQKTLQRTGLAEFTEYTAEFLEESQKLKAYRKGVEELLKNLERHSSSVHGFEFLSLM